MTATNPRHSFWTSADIVSNPTARARASQHLQNSHHSHSRHLRPSQSTTPNASIQELTADLSPQTPLLSFSEPDPHSLVELQHQLAQPVGLERQHTRSLSGATYAVPRGGSSSLRRTIVQKRLMMFMVLKCGLEAFIATWAVFNIVRYLISYSRYTSSAGQVASLALALSASFSLAFLGCAILLSTLKISLVRSIPIRASHVIRKVLRFTVAFFMLAPAIANVVFLFTWRDSDIQELAYQNRCNIDIDLVWSVSEDNCAGLPWKFWLLLAFFRLAVTLVVLIAYLIVSNSYGRIHRLSISRRPSVLAPSETSGNLSFLATPKKEPYLVPRHSQAIHRTSRSTLSSNVESTSSIHPLQSAPRMRAASSTSSEDENSIRLPPGLSHNQPHPNVAEGDQNWASLSPESFHDHFNIIVSQVNYETDDAVIRSRSPDDEGEEGYCNNPSSTAQHSESPYCYDLPPVPFAVGYNEFGQPYPPEEPLPILNGYIRRMPTIESMGSRELGSLNSSSMHTTNVEQKLTGSARSTMTFDSPPTRLSRCDLATGGTASGGSSSRPNSFGARAELMATFGVPTELGELVVEKVEGAGGRSKRWSSEVSQDLEGGGGEGGPQPTPTGERSEKNPANNITNALSSRSTLSFYTATSGSFTSSFNS